MPPLALRILLLSLSGPMVLGLYMAINQRPVADPLVVTMPGWVPFWPSLTIPYLGMLVIPWYLPLTLTDPQRFRRCLAAFAWAYALTVSLWLLLPTEMPRPQADPANPLHAPWHFLSSVDRPRNILPCGHVLVPVIYLWLIRQERPRWFWPLTALLVFGMLSIAATWQHRPQDIALGTVLAFAGLWLSGSTGRKSP